MSWSLMAEMTTLWHHMDTCLQTTSSIGRCCLRMMIWSRCFTQKSLVHPKIAMQTTLNGSNVYSVIIPILREHLSRMGGSLAVMPQSKNEPWCFFDVTWKRDRSVYILVIRNLIQVSSGKPPFIVKTLYLLSTCVHLLACSFSSSCPPSRRTCLPICPSVR